MKVNVYEASGRVLDWLVATLQNVETDENQSPIWFADDRTPHESHYDHNYGGRLPYTPSTEWAQGGPIIQRERIQWADIHGGIEAWSGWDFPTWLREWDASHRMPIGAGFGRHETSILIAAMRCYVASKLGDEVDVPDELKEKS